MRFCPEKIMAPPQSRTLPASWYTAVYHYPPGGGFVRVWRQQGKVNNL
jgi:hypothetical protein